MTTNRMKSRLSLAALTGILVVLAAVPAGARAAIPPVKLVPSGHITNGFEFLESVAVAPGQNIYVTDAGNHRVQELTPAGTGEFVSMFGKEVNETTKGNICTAVSKNKCKAGVVGAGGGEFGAEGPGSVAVDQSTGNVYVQDLSNWRVQEFTPAGEFVLMFGKEVNENTKGNICTAEEIKKGVKCEAGVQAAPASIEHGAFNFAQGRGNLLAVGPAPEHLLYVGDEQRVQEFNAGGEWKGEIPLTGISTEPGSKAVALAVDQATGEVYLAYRPGSSSVNVVRVFNAAGKELRSFEVAPVHPGANVYIHSLALDGAGHLAVAAYEEGPEGSGPFGALYAAGTGHLITGFANPENSSGLSFNGEPEAEMYAVTRNELIVYKPLPVAELLTSLSTCKPGPELETSATLDCGLNGTANPEGVAETEVFVEWGRTQALSETTPKQTIATGTEPKAVSAPVEGVRPNETLFYRLAGFDHNVQAPETLRSETASFTTPIVAAKIPGAPSVSFVKSSSAVMSSALNPENASTTYEFQYGACENLESCPGIASTPAAQSNVYGKISTTLQAKELQPATLYHYRLSTEDENTAKTEKQQSNGPEGTFTTAPVPVPQAASGAASAIAATSATVSGTVNPDGQPATYTFELGVYEGPQTQYGIVFTGPAGTGTAPIPESLGLTGLQPGTTYAYRIKVASGYGTQTGEPVLFTTQGLPAVLASPTPLLMLAIPNIAFPKAVTTATTKALTNAQKLSKALVACKKKSKSKRSACQKQARKQYAKSKQANNKKRG
jgi:NHL repeat